MAKRVNYRKIAFDAYDPLCAHCGFGVPAVLEVAHIDGDRANNAVGNLVILCPFTGFSLFLLFEPINDFKPSPIESAWEKARAVLINDPENMSKMGEKLFSITYDETKVYGLTQQKVTSENTSFLLAEVPPQTETQNHESLGEQ
jgi:hypothetical protein